MSRIPQLALVKNLKALTKEGMRPHRPRKHRDINRGRIAALQAKARGDNAMQVALAEISATFDQAAVINGLKLRVEDVIERGPCDGLVKARYGMRAAMLASSTLDEAIAKATEWLAHERKRFEAGSILGHPIRAPLELIRELRLILRLIRWQRHKSGFDQLPGIVRFLTRGMEQNVA